MNPNQIDFSGVNATGTLGNPGLGGIHTRSITLVPSGAPTASTAGFESGHLTWTGDYLYVKTGTIDNTWGRVHLSPLTEFGGVQAGITHGGGTEFPLVFESVDAVNFTDAKAQDPIITLPAGQSNFIIDCVIGTHQGTTNNIIIAELQNTTDNRYIPNSRKELTYAGGEVDNEIFIRIISGFDLSQDTTVQLFAGYSGANQDPNGPYVRSTGTWISFIRI